jgi:hypothetical protein
MGAHKMWHPIPPISIEKQSHHHCLSVDMSAQNYFPFGTDGADGTRARGQGSKQIACFISKF